MLGGWGIIGLSSAVMVSTPIPVPSPSGGRGRSCPLEQVRAVKAPPPVGEGLGWGLNTSFFMIQFFQFVQDGGEDGVRLLQDVVVPKTQYAKALRFEVAGAVGVVARLGSVLSTVCFDNQARVGADEIHDVAAYRLLSAEFVAIQLLAAQASPKASFRFRHVAAQVSCLCQQGRVVGGKAFFVHSADRGFGDMYQTPIPVPSPSGGRERLPAKWGAIVVSGEGSAASGHCFNPHPCPFPQRREETQLSAGAGSRR